jgi:predicted esterase
MDMAIGYLNAPPFFVIHGDRDSIVPVERRASSPKNYETPQPNRSPMPSSPESSTR